jgi:hypothetical protein
MSEPGPDLDFELNRLLELMIGIIAICAATLKSLADHWVKRLGIQISKNRPARKQSTNVSGIGGSHNTNEQNVPRSQSPSFKPSDLTERDIYGGKTNFQSVVQSNGKFRPASDNYEIVKD